MDNQLFLEKVTDLLFSPENSKTSDKFFSELKKSIIYVYGAGNAGAMTVELLGILGISIRGFWDRNADKICKFKSKPVDKPFSSKTEKGANVIIIIAFICGYEELKKTINKVEEEGFYNIIYYHEIYNFLIKKDFQDSISFKSNSKPELLNIKKVKSNILSVAAMLEDKKSMDVYMSFFQAITHSNCDLFARPEKAIQYFVDDVPFSKGYDSFVDCGAFDGDTMFLLSKLKQETRKIVLFEPDVTNYNNLINNIKESEIKKEIISFPCGVWDKTEKVRFSSGSYAGCKITEEGNDFIQCVKIDDALQNFLPTFIKMDIEGSELKALKGAERTIIENRPDLAICVYHKIEDMWEIPLLIKSINANYKFYLRSHGLYGMETVLYAVCP